MVELRRRGSTNERKKVSLEEAFGENFATIEGNEEDLIVTPQLERSERTAKANGQANVEISNERSSKSRKNC